MKFLFKGLLIVSVLLVISLIAGMTLPEHLHVEREVIIKAAQNKIFPYLVNYRLFSSWSYWSRLDPVIKYQFAGPELGKGAIMHWQSRHPDIGSGSQKIISVELGSQIKIILAINGVGKAYSTFILEPAGDSTKVIRSFDMHFGYNIPGRIAGLFMEKKIEAEYQASLALLRQIIEMPALQ